MFARWTSLLLVGVVCLALSASGCGEKGDKDGRQAKAKGDAGKLDKDKEEHKHDGWWCQDHGVPEYECSLCLPDAEVKKRFKDQGDWCALHERAQSQCFRCDPAKYKTFEDKYVAKFGKKPEKPPESEFEK